MTTWRPDRATVIAVVEPQTRRAANDRIGQNVMGAMARWIAVTGVTAALAGGAKGATPDGTLHDDHGEGLTATLLPIGWPLGGTLSHPGDVDVFRLDLAGTARVEMRTTGAAVKKGRLLDGSRETIAQDDDPSRANVRMVEALESGTYYLEVWGEPGDYTVMARLANALDAGDSEAASMLLPLHDLNGPSGMTPDSRLGVSGRIWPTTSDVDVYRLDVPRDGTAVTVRSSGGRLMRARLVDSSLADVATAVRADNVHIHRPLDAGTYYVVVGGDRVGPYRLLATGDWRGDACAEPVVVRDDGGTPESSTLLTVGGPPVPATIRDDGDVDVFRLDVAGDALVEVRTSGRTDTRGRLFARSGRLIASDEDSGPGGRNFEIAAELSTGIYYVAVTAAPGARGEYAVAARVGGASDHTALPWTSTRLPLYGAEDLARASPDMLLGTSGHIWPAEDEDVFRLDVPRDGLLVRVRTSGGTALHARLSQAGDGLVEIASADPIGDIRLETRLDAGIYYLRIGGHETGAYRVLAWGYEPGFAPPDKATFDHLVAGGLLVGAQIESVHFRPERRFESRMGEAAADDGDVRRSRPLLGDGRYSYERGACRDWGWLELDYDDGGRCLIGLSFESETTARASVACGDEPSQTSDVEFVDGSVHIPDSNLKDAIRSALGRPSGDNAPITKADVARLKHLFCCDGNVGDLTGLESATGLTSLFLDSGLTLDLTPLAGLTRLENLTLRLSNNEDLTPLAGLTALRQLSLSNSKVSDLSPLAGLTGLSWLSLAGTKVSDLTALAGLTGLLWLDLSDNDVSDLTPLVGLNGLSRLYLSSNRISDLSPLAGLASLKWLRLSHNEIADVTPLAGLTKLVLLYLSNNRISDATPLAALTRLIWIDLSHNRISDMWLLPGPPRLVDLLDLSDNEISDLTPLSGRVALLELDLANNRISDIAVFARRGVPSRKLDLSGNLIADLSPLAGHTYGALVLADNYISDLSPLSAPTTVHSLDLRFNEISDLTPLGGLRAVNSLSLAHNRIVDLSPLASLLGLRHLYLANNRISEVAALSRMTHLTTLDLRDNDVSDLSPLSGRRIALRHLYLANNRISDLGPLSRLPPTAPLDLDLAGNRVSDLSPLAGRWYGSLGLSDNEIVDLSPLSGVVSGALDLSHNEISDLWPLADVDESRFRRNSRILLQGNRITDASALTDVSPVNTLDLGHNAISRVPDVEYPRERLDLAGNQFSDLPHLPDALKRLNLEGNAMTTPPDLGSLAELYLGANAISDLGSLVAHARRVAQTPHSLSEVSLWRNPLSETAQDSQLSELGGVQGVEVLGGGQILPLLADAPVPRSGRRGVVRLVNPGPDDGDAWLYVPRLGNDARPAAVVVPKRSVVRVDADDLSRGERGKRVYGQLPIGGSDAALEVYTSSEIRAQAYVRTADGFLTSMHDTATQDARGRHVLPIFNPADGSRPMSRLRLVNIGDTDANVSVMGIDDAGVSRGPVRIVLPAWAATVVDADALENGTGEGMSGRLGDGEGRWRLEVSSDGAIMAMGLLENPNGHLTNLSTTAPDDTVALFPSASHPNLQGWVRIVNRGPDTEVNVLGVDDTGAVLRPSTVRIAAGRAIEFSSHDWDNGNASKGLTGGGSPGTGDWRLRFASEGDVLVSAYVESPDGFLSNMHDTVPGSTVRRSRCPSPNHCRSSGAGMRFHTVAPFSVGAEGVVSSLRLVNDGEDATVTIWGIDQRGNVTGRAMLNLAAGRARTLTAGDLQEGEEGLTGSLRGGTGMWELLVRSAGGQVTVVNLMEDASGRMTNLSTAPYHPVVDAYR